MSVISLFPGLWVRTTRLHLSAAIEWILLRLLVPVEGHSVRDYILNQEKLMKLDHGDLTRCSATALRKAMRRVTQLYDDTLRPVGLTVTQYALMTEILRRGSNAPTVTELADAMVMDRSGLGHTLRPLERDGYVALVQHKEDGRQRGVVLTKSGRAMQRKATPLWENAQRRVVEVVGRDERADLQMKLLAIAHDDRLTYSANSLRHPARPQAARKAQPRS
jgi:DNA-binding MarR family transcriptional regulator